MSIKATFPVRLFFYPLSDYSSSLFAAFLTAQFCLKMKCCGDNNFRTDRRRGILPPFTEFYFVLKFSEISKGGKRQTSILTKNYMVIS